MGDYKVTANTETKSNKFENYKNWHNYVQNY